MLVTLAPGNNIALSGASNPTATGIPVISITQEDAANCNAAGSDGLCVAYVIKGTASPRLANNGQGFYLRYGWTDPNGWKPSDGYGSSTRVAGMYTAWVRPGAVGGHVAGSEAVEYELKEDGSFTAEVWAHQVPGHPMASGNYGFFTVPAHGATGAEVSAWETKSALQIG